MSEEINEQYQHLLNPISEDAPCGENLEYENDYLLLMSKVERQDTVQYGDFVSEVTAISWSEVLDEVEQLLTRTKDIRLLMLWMRAQINRQGAQGLNTGLKILIESLKQYPEQIHPQLEQDGERDELYRVSALNSLTDVEGLLKELRQLTIGSNPSNRLALKDIEYALTNTRAADALPIPSVVQHMNAWMSDNDTTLTALALSHEQVAEFQLLINEQMTEQGVDLAPLSKLLQWFSATPPSILVKNGLYNPNGSDGVEEVNQGDNDPNIPSNTMVTLAGNNNVQGRMMAQQYISQAQQWFETNEPSSPVALLLHQAQKMIGKPFEEIFQTIPPELVQQWRINQTANADEFE